VRLSLITALPFWEGSVAMSDHETRRVRPPVYAVLFNAPTLDPAYEPTINFRYDINSGVTVPHGFDREVASALPGLWYCLHLPNDPSTLVDIPAPVLSAARALDLDHHILLVPVAVFEPAYVGRWLEYRGIPALAVCPDELLEEVTRRADRLGFGLPPAAYSQLTNDTLRSHWEAIYALLAPPDAYLGRVPALTNRLDLAPIDLPRRWLARQLLEDVTPPAANSDDRGDLVGRALHAQAFLAAIARLEREGATMELADRQMPEVLAEERLRLRIPVSLALPGVASLYARAAYSPSLRRRIQPLPATDETDTFSQAIGTRSDPLVERAAIEFAATHRALARGGLALMLPSLPPLAFGVLAQLEQHFNAPTQRGSSVWALLDQLDAVTGHLWTDELVALVAHAAMLTVFTNFPLGLLRLPGDTSPLCTRVPIAYQPLLPLTRTVQAELTYVPPVDLSARLRVLVAECIPARDPVGALSRVGWSAAAQLQRDETRMTFEMVETLSVDALRTAIGDHRPHILVISAHGVFGRGPTVAGLQIGDETVLGPGLEPLPPVVMLSACSVAPRGASTVSVTDLLLREGAVAVLGTQVPVDVRRNAILMMRFLVYVTEVLAGREQHPTLLDVWHRVQASNAVNDVLSGNPSLNAWGGSSTADNAIPVLVEFMNVRSAGQLRAGHVYADTERVLAEIADARGEGDRVRNWLVNPGYVPESLFYVFAGRPDRVYLHPFTDLIDESAA
jgi:CHAT domain